MKHRNRLLRWVCLTALLLSFICCGKVSLNATVSRSPYCLAWITDTQIYSESYPEIYQNMTRWIANQQEAQNIKAVIHTGDITNDGSDNRQWKNATAAMAVLEDRLPCAILAGNHDVQFYRRDFTAYRQAFDTYGNGTFSGAILRDGRGQAMALLLDGESWNYVILALCWEPDDAALNWGNTILQQYADRIAIVATHDYMRTDLTLSGNGETIFSRLVEPNPNVRLVLCGHNHTAGMIATEIGSDQDGTEKRTVYQLIADYQAEAKGGSGFLRLLTIDEAAKTLTVKTYSPYLGQYNCYSANVDDFIINFNTA